MSDCSFARVLLVSAQLVAKVALCFLIYRDLAISQCTSHLLFPVISLTFTVYKLYVQCLTSHLTLSM